VPLYEYQCRKCGRFEVIQKFSDAPLSVCPTCEGEVQKLLSAPAIQFKGSGWYVTDYAKKSSAGGEAKKDGASAPAANSSDASSSPAQSSSKDGAASGSSTPK
jgi:putative FmdB family regulatory protein